MKNEMKAQNHVKALGMEQTVKFVGAVRRAVTTLRKDCSTTDELYNRIANFIALSVMEGSPNAAAGNRMMAQLMIHAQQYLNAMDDSFCETDQKVLDDAVKRARAAQHG